MNRTGRPWKIHPDILIPRLVELRGIQKLSHKKIGLELGYSWDRIRRICCLYGIRKGLKPKRDMHQAAPSSTVDGGTVRPDET